MQSPAQKPRVRLPRDSKNFQDTMGLAKLYGLNTVCQEAACPNIAECWSKKHATFMILGSVCTRACRFCNVKTGMPDKLDPHEPEKISEAVKKLDLKHVVLTSVDRDDLEDGGAGHFADCVNKIRLKLPSVTVEILTPDFLGKPIARSIILKSQPDVFNHNTETVPRLYAKIRPKARYFNSLSFLSEIKDKDPTIFTKSGLMVGLGEKKEEVLQVMDDLRAAKVDFITIGQYLRPTPKHAEVAKYVLPQEFEYYKKSAYSKGFLMVSASALTRSSYHAGDDFKKLKAERVKRLKG